MQRIHHYANAYRAHGFVVLFFLSLLIFSCWLMWHTFRFDTQRQSMEIATTVWSDFGAHIPLIRSFSYGDNLTKILQGLAPESPLFPGEPIRYHFLFYAIVGLLEKIGLRIDWVLNLLSALGFFSLLTMIWLIAKGLTKSRRAALLSVIFFLFNGSFAFLSYFQKHPWSFDSITGIVTNTRFPSFGPWDGGLVTAFWNLNIYTNQRHLAISYAIVLWIIYRLLKEKERFPESKKFGFRESLLQSLQIGLLTDLLLFTNQAAFAIALLFLGWFFIIQKSLRKQIAISLLTLIPFVFLFTLFTQPSSGIQWHPGYLMAAPLTFFSVIEFWLHNLGLHIVLIPLGFFVAPRSMKLLFAPLLFLFVVPNLWQFSPDMINNHKFFNFFLILGNIYTAYFVIWISNILLNAKFKALNSRILLRLTFYPLFLLLLVLLTFSGIIDFFVIANDRRGSIPDVIANEDIQFFSQQTNPSDVILNSTWFYHPANIAGRKIYSGYPYFTWSYGYDKTIREEKQFAIYQAKTKKEACTLLQQESIAYVGLSEKPEDIMDPNRTLWKTEFVPAYISETSGLTVYEVEENCNEYYQ